ncbi:hypothetical protein DPX16_11660 [Anabarilius grahami]|uniref:Uncharacterized protein n=1 Tax=Anabarilius grahami TaxID=495550 RepID=A0A3N0XF30_ANAGA|nr:hypothetical protein DPX16_11660 [Anabarilius grahami]
MKWGKFVSSSLDVVVSAATSTDGVKSPSSSSSSQRCKFPSLLRVFRKILSMILPCVSSCELDQSSTIETQTASVDTHTDVLSDASSSPAVSRFSDQEFDPHAVTQEKEAIRDVPGEESSTSSSSSAKKQTLRSGGHRRLCLYQHSVCFLLRRE